MEYYNNSKRPKKPMTEQQALLKLTTLSAHKPNIARRKCSTR